MDKIKLEILGLSPSQAQAGSFALVLGEEFGTRRLPIIIGMFEAQAIAIEIEKIQPNRPMTHDLFKSFAKAFNYTIKEVVISDLREGIFFARLFCTDGMRDTVIDTRPSDAIALALRFNVPIFTFENIMTEAGVESSSNSDDEMAESDTASSAKPRPAAQHLKNLNVDELNQLLMEALSHEEYERAAKIRDEIERRN